MPVNDEKIYEPSEKKIILEGNMDRFVKKTSYDEKAKIDEMALKHFMLEIFHL